jgi:hypothetical protein
MDQKKKRVIREIIHDLHGGLTMEKARERITAEVGTITSTEITEIEQSLITEGVPAEEIKRFCNVHALLFQSGDEFVHRLLKMRAKTAHRVGEGLQPLTERGVHVAGLDIGLVQRLVERFLCHLQAPLVLAAARRPPIRKDPELLRFTPGFSIALRAGHG